MRNEKVVQVRQSPLRFTMQGDFQLIQKNELSHQDPEIVTSISRQMVGKIL
jgi:hypothetical protein